MFSLIYKFNKYNYPEFRGKKHGIMDKYYLIGTSDSESDIEDLRETFIKDFCNTYRMMYPNDPESHRTNDDLMKFLEFEIFINHFDNNKQYGPYDNIIAVSELETEVENMPAAFYGEAESFEAPHVEEKEESKEEATETSEDKNEE